MEKIVFFLGAGASKPFGLPLTKEILPNILSCIHKKALFYKIDKYDYKPTKRREMENDLRKFLYLLMPGLEDLFEKYRTCKPKVEKEKIKFPLITDILSIVDHLSANNNIPFPMKLLAKNRDMNYYRMLLDRAIYEILATDEDFSKKEYSVLQKYVQYINQLINKESCQVTIITTNYDATVEYKIYVDVLKKPEDIDFGFSWRDLDNQETIRYQPKYPKLRIYKLHGSLNWLKCDLCDYLYINPEGNIIHQSFRLKIDDNNSCHCGNAPLKSMIVAPSFEREIKEPSLLHVWKSSVQALREADKWIIIGYSMPAEDLAIKSLLIRGKNARDKPLIRDNLKIVQYGNHSLNSYSLIFGKDNFEFIKGGLAQYLNKYCSN